MEDKKNTSSNKGNNADGTKNPRTTETPDQSQTSGAEEKTGK